MSTQSNGDVNYQLGLLNVPWPAVGELKRKAIELAGRQHPMGAIGKVAIPGTMPVRLLCYNAGIDGYDSDFYIEDAPDPLYPNATFSNLVREALDILAADPPGKDDWRWERWMAAANSLLIEVEGHKPEDHPAVTEMSGTPTPVRHIVSPVSGAPISYRCTCGHIFIQLHAPHGPHPCPADPKHVPCR